jgi:hypothetical protein
VHAKQKDGSMKTQLHWFLTSALDGAEQSPAASFPVKTPPLPPIVIEQEHGCTPEPGLASYIKAVFLLCLASNCYSSDAKALS